ncbi:hypothetical protein ACW9KT_15570 [Hymenobacter sp. HD11105]
MGKSTTKLQTATAPPVTENASAAPTITPTVPPAPADELTKVKFLRSHPSYGYFPGEEGELPARFAETLIVGGFAEKA